MTSISNKYIPGVLFAFHTFDHASNKCTPFDIMHGLTAKLPINLKPTDHSRDRNAVQSTNAQPVLIF